MPINETLGQYSEWLMLSAGLVYLVAFIAFTVDMATSSRLMRQIDERAAAATRGDEAPAEQREMAGAVSAPASAAGSTASSTTTASGSGTSVPIDSTSVNSTVLDEAGPEGWVSPETNTSADDDMAYTGSSRKLLRVGVGLTALAFAIQAVAVVTRGIAANRVPWGNMYEFCTTGALLVAGVFLAVLTRKDIRFLGTFVTGLVLIMLCAAATVFHTPVAHLIPALQSYWLIIHVSVAVFASALFTISFALSVLQLFQDKREKALAQGRVIRGLAFLRRVPSAQALENLSYRINAVSFVFWTFTLIAGAVWAEHAWGRYWGWDPKETWTFIVWVIYAAYLHARATRGWSGTRAAWLSIAGYICVLINFTLVNTVFQGLHSYSGL